MTSAPANICCQASIKATESEWQMGQKPRPETMPFPGNIKKQACDDGSNCQKVEKIVVVGDVAYVT